MHSTPNSSPDWERLLDLVRVLRGPAGCPWDRAQTATSLAGHLIEEAYEVLDAARSGRVDDLAEEIGDAAFLLALVRQELEERGGPPFDAILRRTVEKLTRRHPHVFGDRTAGDPREAARLWEEMKRAERAAGAAAAAPEGADAETPPPRSHLADVLPPDSLPEPPPALPALLQAQRIQEKAAAVGFDWPDAFAVLPKIEEELEELRLEMRADAPAEQRVREEAGDLIFAVVNLTRSLGIDAEDALRAATRKFRRRFNHMAAQTARSGVPLHELRVDQMEVLWTAAKDDEKGCGSKIGASRSDGEHPQETVGGGPAGID